MITDAAATLKTVVTPASGTSSRDKAAHAQAAGPLQPLQPANRGIVARARRCYALTSEVRSSCLPEPSMRSIGRK